MKIGKLEVDLTELQEFVVEAGKNSYAGNIEPKRMPDGSKTYTFQKGNFHYTDNYAGSFQAPGNEIVRWQREDGQRIWQMSYSGGMLPEFWDDEILAKKTFEFLKRVLIKGDFENPFRGPPEFEDENFFYGMNVNGNIKKFSGDEDILYKKINEIVFSQDFIGGLAIPK